MTVDATFTAEYSIAAAYALLGDNDKALQYLRRPPTACRAAVPQ